MTRKILLIDDDVVVLCTLEIVLGDRGYDVVTAKDGVEGLRLFQENPPDLVITDLVMPEKEGIETIIEMRRERPDTKIIAISGGGRTHDGCFLKMAAELGAAAILPKPFMPDELAAKIEEVMQ